MGEDDREGETGHDDNRGDEPCKVAAGRAIIVGRELVATAARRQRVWQGREHKCKSCPQTLSSEESQDRSNTHQQEEEASLTTMRRRV